MYVVCCVRSSLCFKQATHNNASQKVACDDDAASQAQGQHGISEHGMDHDLPVCMKERALTHACVRHTHAQSHIPMRASLCLLDSVCAHACVPCDRECTYARMYMCARACTCMCVCACVCHVCTRVYVCM